MEPQIEYLGVIQAPVRQMKFIENVGERLYNQNVTDKLQLLFEKIPVDHRSQRHRINGYIELSEMPSFWNNLGVSKEQLKRDNVRGIYPSVHGQPVYYTQGRHRIEAAKNVDASSFWTIELFCVNFTCVAANKTLKSQTEQYQHETPYSDGQIYFKLREYGKSAVDFFEWYHRLSRTKQYVFRSIRQRPAITVALDKLMTFRGILDFLQLGSFNKYFYYRLDEELLAGLTHIHVIWSQIAEDRQLLPVDRDTVQMLEGRIPTLSPADEKHIHMAFKTAQIFPSLLDVRQRREIEYRVQDIQVMIPSMRSLQSNMIYLSIAADIIWTLVAPRDTSRSIPKENISLRATLRQCWAESPPYVEVQEGVFKPVQGAPSFDLAYNQLILAALRQFPYLSDTKPKVHKGEKPTLSIDPNCVSLFQRRAKLLGFCGGPDTQPPVSSGPFVPKELKMNQSTDGETDEKFFSRIDRRWGRPDTRTFRVIQKLAFLPTIVRQTTQQRFNVLFTLHDLLLTFFKPCKFEFDSSRPYVSLNSSPHGNSLVEVTTPAHQGIQCNIAPATVCHGSNTHGADSGRTSTTTAHHVRKKMGIGGFQIEENKSVAGSLDSFENRRLSMGATERRLQAEGSNAGEELASRTRSLLNWSDRFPTDISSSSSTASLSTWSSRSSSFLAELQPLESTAAPDRLSLTPSPSRSILPTRSQYECHDREADLKRSLNNAYALPMPRTTSPTLREPSLSPSLSPLPAATEANTNYPRRHNYTAALRSSLRQISQSPSNELHAAYASSPSTRSPAPMTPVHSKSRISSLGDRTSLDAQALESIHAFLRSIPRGADACRELSGRQGFSDSDDDIVSIAL